MKENNLLISARMTEATRNWLSSLDPKQHVKASFAFEDARERSDWAYFPRDHRGLPLLEQDGRQQKLLHALLASTLSLPAYAKATAIMALESVLNELEGRQLDTLRDPGRYFLSVFGSPGDERWGWRFEGHHVCLNCTVADGKIVSSTPIFLGANPAEVTRGDAAVIRPCGEEEEAARALLSSLNEDQHAEAVICEVAPPDFVLSNAPLVPDTCSAGKAPGASPSVLGLFKNTTPDANEAVRFERDKPKGLPASRMNASQRTLLSDLIDVYVSRLAAPLAEVVRTSIAIAGVHFAWAGETERRRPHYYRLQGSSFLVEYDNTQNDANHVHAVWRDPDLDFGGDALREHMKLDHDPV
ncbi:MAG: DUF3500 domain-containing protein [Chloroflexi bacterium]|nr:DUF3500 domain-containing protein [Chloroflexota bacterium]